MKKLMFTLAAFAALCVGTLYAAHIGNGDGVENRDAATGRSAAFGIVPSGSVEISWTGRGFLCLKRGNFCTVKIGIGLNVADAPLDVPAGARVGVILTTDGAPIPEMSDVTFGPGEVHQSEMTPVDGSPLPTSSISFPEQAVSYNHDAGGYLFYYFES